MQWMGGRTKFKNERIALIAPQEIVNNLNGQSNHLQKKNDIHLVPMYGRHNGKYWLLSTESYYA